MNYIKEMDKLRKWLQGQTGNLPKIAKETNLSYGWLNRFRDGAENVTIKNLQELEDYRNK